MGGRKIEVGEINGMVKITKELHGLRLPRNNKVKIFSAICYACNEEFLVTSRSFRRSISGTCGCVTNRRMGVSKQTFRALRGFCE